MDTFYTDGWLDVKYEDGIWCCFQHNILYMTIVITNGLHRNEDNRIDSFNDYVALYSETTDFGGKIVQVGLKMTPLIEALIKYLQIYFQVAESIDFKTYVKQFEPTH